MSGALGANFGHTEDEADWTLHIQPVRVISDNPRNTLDASPLPSNEAARLDALQRY